MVLFVVSVTVSLVITCSFSTSFAIHVSSHAAQNAQLKAELEAMTKKFEKLQAEHVMLKEAVARKEDEDTLYKELDALVAQYGLVEGHSNEFPEEVQTMNNFASDPRVHTICETGFNAGHGALRWLLHSNAQIYSFDLGRWNYSKPVSEFLQQKFPGRLSVIWGDSTQTLPDFITNHQDVKCNIIFVDGGHSYDVATADLKNFMRMSSSTHNVVLMDDVGCGIGCVDTDKAWGEMIDSHLVTSTHAVVHSTGTRGYAFGSYSRPAVPARSEIPKTCTTARTSDLVCANFPRPRIAHCLHGQARTLSHPLVYRTARANVVEALGGDVVSFASINLPKPGTDHWDPSEQSEAAVKAALVHIGVSEQNMKFYHPPHDTLNQSSLPTCGHSPGTDAHSQAHFIGAIAQLTNRARCMGQIENDEQLSGLVFDYVIVQRADLMWIRPMSPHCLLGAKLQQVAMVGTDHVFLTKRSTATIVFKNFYASFLSCSHVYTAGDFEETYVQRYLQNNNLVYTENDESLPAYPLRNRNFAPQAAAQLNPNMCKFLTPNIGNCMVDLPQVMYGNVCNAPF